MPAPDSNLRAADEATSAVDVSVEAEILNAAAHPAMALAHVSAGCDPQDGEALVTFH